MKMILTKHMHTGTVLETNVGAYSINAITRSSYCFHGVRKSRSKPGGIYLPAFEKVFPKLEEYLRKRENLALSWQSIYKRSGKLL